jgi:hypothetical protein
MTPGDAVRHDKHGIGVLESIDQAAAAQVLFLRGRAKVRLARLRPVASRADLIAALTRNEDLPTDQLTAALIYLRSPIVPVYMAAAAYFAQRQSLVELSDYIRALGPIPSEAIRGRMIAATQKLAADTKDPASNEQASR